MGITSGRGGSKTTLPSAGVASVVANRKRKDEEGKNDEK
jgi:hypothetical protein